MLNKNFQIRLGEDEIAEIEKQAKSSGLTSSALARLFIRDGLARIDRKHEALLHRLETLQKTVDESSLLAAMSVAAVSFLDIGRIDGKTVSGQTRVKEHIKTATKMGRVLKKVNEDGLLDK